MPTFTASNLSTKVRRAEAPLGALARAVPRLAARRGGAPAAATHRAARVRGRPPQGWKVRSATDRTIRAFAHQNFGKILSEFRNFFSQFFRNSENVKTSQHFLEYSAKSGEKNHQNLINFRWKLSKNHDFLRKFKQKFEEVWRIFANILNWERCEGVWILYILKDKKWVFGCKNRLRCRRERAL